MADKQIAKRKYPQSNWITPVGLALALAAYLAGWSWAVILIGLVTIVVILTSRGAFSRDNIRRRKELFLNWCNSTASRQKFAAVMFGGLILAWILGFIVFEDGSAASNLMVFVTFGLILMLALTVVTTKVKPDSQALATGQRTVKTSKKKNGGTHG